MPIGRPWKSSKPASRASFAAAAIPDPEHGPIPGPLEGRLDGRPPSSPFPRRRAEADGFGPAPRPLCCRAAGLYLVFFRLDPTVDFVPYAFSDARSGLALSLADDDALAQAFDSAIRASLDEAVAAVPAPRSSPWSPITGRYLDSLSDEEVLLLEAAIQESKAL